MTVQSPVSMHCIVCEGEQIVCDPAQYEDGWDAFRASDQDGCVWVEFLVPLSHVTTEPRPPRAKNGE